MLPPVRALLLPLVVAALASLPIPARADSPPMPPCPPGWEQRGDSVCAQPFECPVGWKLDEGPRCVPWQCKEDRDCGWKGNVPCVAADLCFEPGADRAQRVCEPSGAARCPAGLSCRAGKLCGAQGQTEQAPFTNWAPAGARVDANGDAKSDAKSAPTGAPKGDDTPPTAPRKGGCGSCGVGAGGSGALALAASFAAIASIALRRARR